MAPRKLRAVAADEKPVRKPMTVLEAAESGSHRDLLVALRDRIAKTVQSADCHPRDMAALSRRLQDIAKELAVLDSVNEEDDIGRAADTPDEGWEAI